MRVSQISDLVWQEAHGILTYDGFPIIAGTKSRTNNPLERIMKEISALNPGGRSISGRSILSQPRGRGTTLNLADLATRCIVGITG
jgi:hypothetical protein